MQNIINRILNLTGILLLIFAILLVLLVVNVGTYVQTAQSVNTKLSSFVTEDAVVSHSQNTLSLSESTIYLKRTGRLQSKSTLKFVAVSTSNNSASKNKGYKIVSAVLVIGLGFVIVTISLITAFTATWRRHKRNKNDEI